MKNKMTISELKQYVLAEAKRLYKIQTLKEASERIDKELSLLNECVPPTYDKNGNPDYIAGAPLMSPETLAKMRAEMLKKAAGWAIPESNSIISEMDKKAMKAAKKDIEADFLKFTPLGKNRFEKHLDKKELRKAMSPEKNLEEKKGKAVNPWAICHASTGPEKDAKFERCVMDVKAKNKIKKESPDPANDADSVKGSKP